MGDLAPFGVPVNIWLASKVTLKEEEIPRSRRLFPHHRESTKGSKIDREMGAPKAILPRRQLLILFCVGLVLSTSSADLAAEEASLMRHLPTGQSPNMEVEMGDLNETLTPTGA